MKYDVLAQLLLPVRTTVEADSEEEAVKIARKRALGKNEETEWVLDESQFAPDAVADRLMVN